MGISGDGYDPYGPGATGPGRPDRAEQLSLTDPDMDERLPWLESDEADLDEGVDATRIVLFALVGLLAVATLVGGIWWVTRDAPDVDMVAAGQVIEAPDEPYKVRPEGRGAADMPGTGDTSFAVAEGRKVEGYIAEGRKPIAIAIAPAPATNDDAATPAAPATPVVAGIGVQIGAYSSRAAAETAWQQLSGRLEPLQGRSHRVVEGTADSGSIYRLQAVAPTRPEAAALCHALRAAGGDCQVKR